MEQCRVWFDDEEGPCALIVEAESLELAEKQYENDPYYICAELVSARFEPVAPPWVRWLPGV